MEEHTSDWLRVVWISRLGQIMNGRTYKYVLCYRLGVPLFSVLKPRSACSRVLRGYRDHYVSCTGSSPLTQIGMIDFVPGHAMIDAAQRKRVKCEAKCAKIRYGFLSFSFSAFGELEKDAVTLLKRIQKISIT
nr:ABC transporter A family member 9-like [Tanacetum cinerariifolium]